MDAKKQKQIQCLQDNLSSIRKIAGWTAEELGEQIGVTKQTISNLENKKTPMTLTQYIAIRSVIDYEIATNKENTILPQVVTILLDNYEALADEDYDKVKEAAAAVSASAASGAAAATLSAMLTGALTPIGGMAVGLMGPASVVAGGAAYWLAKLHPKKKNKEKKQK